MALNDILTRTHVEVTPGIPALYRRFNVFGSGSGGPENSLGRLTANQPGWHQNAGWYLSAPNNFNERAFSQVTLTGMFIAFNNNCFLEAASDMTVTVFAQDVFPQVPPVGWEAPADGVLELLLGEPPSHVLRLTGITDAAWVRDYNNARRPFYLNIPNEQQSQVFAITDVDRASPISDSTTFASLGTCRVPLTAGTPDVETETTDTIYAERIDLQSILTITQDDMGNETQEVEFRERYRVRHGLLSLFNRITDMRDNVQKQIVSLDGGRRFDEIETRYIRGEGTPSVITQPVQIQVPQAFTDRLNAVEAKDVEQDAAIAANTAAVAANTAAIATAHPGARKMRMGWSQTQAIRASIFTRANSHPIDGAAEGQTDTGIRTPPAPPALSTDETLYTHFWIAGVLPRRIYRPAVDPVTVWHPGLEAGDNELQGPTPLTVSGVAGHAWANSYRETPPDSQADAVIYFAED